MLFFFFQRVNKIQRISNFSNNEEKQKENTWQELIRSTNHHFKIESLANSRCTNPIKGILVIFGVCKAFISGMSVYFCTNGLIWHWCISLSLSLSFNHASRKLRKQFMNTSSVHPVTRNYCEFDSPSTNMSFKILSLSLPLVSFDEYFDFIIPIIDICLI